MEFDEKELDLEDAWIKFELSNEHLSFGQYVRKLEDEGYTIKVPEKEVITI